MHTHFPKGKRVLLIYKNGTQQVVKFWMADGKWLRLLDREPIKLSRLRAITYYREQP